MVALGDVVVVGMAFRKRKSLTGAIGGLKE